jgi:hypothetical protein
MKVYVTTEESCYDSYLSSEPYGDWYEHWDCRVNEVYIQKEAGHYYADSFKLGDVDLKSGSPVFVLVMHYDTGDSFGRATGKMEVLWVFDNYQDASDARKAVEANQEEFSVKFETARGEIKMSNPGAGYFESVNNIDIVDRILR